MPRGPGIVWKSTGAKWRAAITGLVLALPALAPAQTLPVSFTKVVDTATPIPGGSGNFLFFTDPFTNGPGDARPAASIDNGSVAFAGSGAAGQQGLYAAQIGGPLTLIADTGTALPDGSGRFVSFGTPSLDEGHVAFAAESSLLQRGAYLATPAGAIRTVADRNSTVAGGTAPVRSIGQVALDDGAVAFVYTSDASLGIAVADDAGQLTAFAATTSAFSGLAFEDGVVAFIVDQASIHAAAPGSAPALIVGPPAFPALLGFNPSIDDGSIAFLAQSSGIYRATLDGAVAPLVPIGTPIPEGAGGFIGFDADSPSQRDGIVAFHGFGDAGQEGIYAHVGGSLFKVIDVGDALDGKTLAHLFLGYEAVSRRQIAFAAQFADGSRGLYVARLGEDSDADGVADGDDACPRSDVRRSVVIGRCDSGVPNPVSPQGCTIADLVAACAGGNHGSFASCAADVTKAASLTGMQRGAIQRCAALASAMPPAR